MEERYYSLKLCQNDTYNRRGKRIVCRDSDLVIGQTEFCDLRLPCTPGYEEAELAAIRRSSVGDCWILVRLSRYSGHGVSVNGLPVSTFCRLSDGDIISFEGQKQEIKFQIHRDNGFDGNGTVVVEKGLSSRMTAVLLLLPVILFGFLLWTFWGITYKDRIPANVIKDIRSSVYQLTVDSIKYVSIDGNDTTIIGKCPVCISGTAFFTEDSLLVTARHCIEPWLNVPEKVLINPLSIKTLYVRWALLAETHNQFNEDGCEHKVISYCSLFCYDKSKTKVMSFRSEDLVMDKSRDLILEIGDAYNLYFWRSISSRPNRIDMMLGDIAYMKVDSGVIAGRKGKIRIAYEEQMIKLSDMNEPYLDCFGFPVSENIGEMHVEHLRSELARKFTISEGVPTSPLYHDRKISEGFSGGPVICGIEGRWYAVSVVSVTDKNNCERAYSVPLTEIKRMDLIDNKYE